MAVHESDFSQNPDENRGRTDERAAGDDPSAIARFANAAEAGFFAHELSLRTDVTVDVRVDEHFDAVLGYWSQRFVICVPAARSAELAALLQDLVDRSESEELFQSRPHAASQADRHLADHELDQDLAAEISRPTAIAADADAGVRWSLEEPRDRGLQPGVQWGPLVLSLAAGSILFWGLRTLNPQPAQQNAAAAQGVPGDLWEQLSRSPNSAWVQRNAEGRVVRTLVFDAVTGNATIAEDLNADGQLDRRVQLERPRQR